MDFLGQFVVVVIGTTIILSLIAIAMWILKWILYAIAFVLEAIAYWISDRW